MGAIEPIHILIVLIVVFLLFGAKRLPELGRSLGSGIHEFKKSTQELHSPLATSVDEAPPAQPRVVASPTQPGLGSGEAAAGASAAAQD